MRCWCRRRFASSSPTLSRTVMRFFVRHQLADPLARVAGEAHVAVGEDADELAVAVLDHRDAGDAVVGHQRQRVGQRLVGVDGDRVDHHAGLEFLDLAHLGGLLVDRQVAVDDAEAAGLRHGDRERAFGHRVHRRRDQRDAQLDLAGDARFVSVSPGRTLEAAGTSRRRRR